MFGTRRIVVGVSGSPGSLRALRYAHELARPHTTLIPVLAWIPPGGEIADMRYPCGYLRRLWAEEASQRLQDALEAAWGDIPADPPVWPVVRRGEPGRILVTIASPADLLVVGAGHRGLLARVTSGSVSHYCLTHARCPVLAIPPPALTRELGHGLLGWVFWHRPLTPDRILQDQGNTAA